MYAKVALIGYLAAASTLIVGAPAKAQDWELVRSGDPSIVPDAADPLLRRSETAGLRFGWAPSEAHSYAAVLAFSGHVFQLAVIEDRRYADITHEPAPVASPADLTLLGRGGARNTIGLDYAYRITAVAPSEPTAVSLQLDVGVGAYFKDNSDVARVTATGNLYVQDREWKVQAAGMLVGVIGFGRWNMDVGYHSELGPLLGFGIIW